LVIICRLLGTRVIEWKTPPRKTNGVKTKFDQMFSWSQSSAHNPAISPKEEKINETITIKKIKSSGLKMAPLKKNNEIT